MANPCINVCTIKVDLIDLLNAPVTVDVANPPKFYVAAPDKFFHNASLILPFSKSVDFDALGQCEIDILETETIEQKLQFFITFPEEYAMRIIQMEPAVVPNQSECPLTKITIAKPFGLS